MKLLDLCVFSPSSSRVLSNENQKKVSPFVSGGMSN
uniref:Uncharacterized protein n=1 Tax=Arundo donax TaxID=35708 RepID=A0A0A9F3A8_ARUDO